VQLVKILTLDELTKQFSDAKVSAVVTIPMFLDKVKAALARTPAGGGRIILVGGDGDGKDTFSLKDLASTLARGFAPKKPDPNSTVLIPYSSGTTGVPKGVVISHRNVIAAIQITDHPSAIIETPEG
jgi:acyl-coenzyme A synthetase/AMP-(fatty) acid ligase